MKNPAYVILIFMVVLAACHSQNQKNSSRHSYDFRAAEYYDYYGVRDSAFYFYNRVVENSLDSLEKGTANFKMGLRQLEAGDYYSAQESLISSIRSLDEKNKEHYGMFSADYNTLANATLELKDYQTAITNYRLAYKFAVDNDSRLYILNNLGVALQKKKDYPSAIALYDTAILQSTNDTSLKAKVIVNSANTKWLADSNYSPEAEFRYALDLRKTMNDSLGINSSFAHLSDYFTHSKPDSSLYYALKRLEIARALPDPTDRLEALSQLAKVCPPVQTKKYMEQYLNLDDSLKNVRSRDRNQYVLIKFDAEKSKADNLLLQKNIIKQRLIIWGTLFVCIIIVLISSVISRIRKRKQKLEMENALKALRLKTSQKVHDVVANGLYRIMNELEHGADIDKEPLLNRIELLYEKSRDISYEDTPIDHESFGQHIQQSLTSFAIADTKVITVGNQQTFWNKVSAVQKHELQLVLEELMVNMHKHSKARNVSVRFREENNTAFIQYKDDGIGFKDQVEFGNGLHNTVNRIKAINGEINFGKSGEEGLAILIKFPLEHS